MADTTTDHETIRTWVEERGGSPARVKRTGRAGDPGILRIDFPGFSGQQSLEPISWDQFFAAFDRNQLAFIYQDRTRGGQPSRFNKLVARDAARPRGRGPSAPAPAVDAEQDAVAMLEAQHRQVEEMLERLSGRDPRSAEFRRTFADLADALAIHTAIEEQIFYPSVKQQDTEDLLEHSATEHLEVKRVLATMIDAAPDADTPAQLEELGGLTEEHVIEEETELFPLVRKLCGADELRELAAHMTELTEELRREGAPRTQVPNETEEPAPI